VIVGTSGHGRLINPTSRVSCWRPEYFINMGTAYKSCAQPSVKNQDLYTDTQWNCGGRDNQWDPPNSGKCGVCGDPYQGPRKSEAGGVYATGTIVREYTKGSTILVEVDITVSHWGNMKFKLCPVNDKTVPATQECFDRYPLARADGKGNEIKIDGERIYAVELVLPSELTCTQCVMQV
ncbi:unnamed protein product, partial [Meganyctiphanes norvegica]